MQPEHVAVIGGGIMGSGIAALFANQGIRSTVFDMSEELAQKAIDKLCDPKAKIPQLYSPRRVRLIRASCVDRYEDELGACDLIVEVVPEIMSLKKKVLGALDRHRKPGTVVSTNTSGLSVNGMVEGLSEDLRRHFLGTHYFHPVRYLPLVELIPCADTDPEVVRAYADFFKKIGKKPVIGRDTPNFIANRVGVYAIGKIFALAQRYRLSVEQVDMLTGTAIGNPKTATFRLADMVGLDTLLHAMTNSFENCPNDECRAELEPPALLRKLVEAGRLGQKSGEGFYKKAGKGKILALDLESFEYKPAAKPRADLVRVAKGYANLPERLRAMVGRPGDPLSLFSRDLLLSSGAYALNRVGEIAEDIATVDNAMCWGFGREIGPIATLDAIGLDRSAELMKEAGIKVPALLAKARETAGSFYRETPEGRSVFDPKTAGFRDTPIEAGTLSIARLRRTGALVRENMSARLIDLGDGVLLCQLDAKMVPAMNPVDDYILAMMAQAHEEIAKGNFGALVIGNQAKHFCAGANLAGVLELAKAGEFGRIEALSRTLQKLNLANLHAPFPVVVAPHGMTLGGGLEIALGGQVRVALSELYCGLVEVGVGLIPAGGGCLRLLQVYQQRKNKRNKPFGPMQTSMAAFDMIGYGKVSSSAEDAKEKGLILPGDVVCPSRDAQLHVAKGVALKRLEGFEPIPEMPLCLPGEGGLLVMEDTISGLVTAGKITPHSAKIAKVQARILSGGRSASPVTPVSEEDLLALEREAFVELCAEPMTQTRMAYMLKKGKPLIN